MTLEEYLRKVVPGCEGINEDGEDGLENLMGLLKTGHPILVVGKEQTGKSTLVRVLHAHGFTNVFEIDGLPKICLGEQIPEDKMIPNFCRNIE